MKMEMNSVEEMNAYLLSENEKYGLEFEEVPLDKWIWRTDSQGVKPFKVLRNSLFLVQLFRFSADTIRMSVNKTMLQSKGRWVDGITWDDLQAIKSMIGYGHRDAVEVYPKNQDLINVSNMRHLWILSDGAHNLKFIWRGAKE